MNAPADFAALLDARYRVGPVLARGGMSTVHRGMDTRLDRPVAIKIMDPRMAADPTFRARFEREARSAARIDHPNVVDVHDQGRVRDTLFLVMELVEGGTLREVLRHRGALGVPVAFAVMEPVLAGLAQAHALGMVHRDVKPENVLLGADGAVKVADFGLVTAAAEAGVSHAGMILGTMAYLSPEQVATGQADARSDVYAAGILFSELLTGAPPYTGDNALSVAYRHVNDDVPAPSRIAGDVPPELDDLILRATSRDPARRPADAAAFRAELVRLRAELGVPRVAVPLPPAQPVEEQETEPAVLPAAGPRGTRALTRGELPEEETARLAPVVDDRPDRTRGRHGTAAAARPEALPDHRIARRRSRRTFAIWIAVVLVLGLLVGGAAWWLGSGRWTAVPSVVGLDRAAAERLLADADLAATVTEELHDDVAADVVAGTDPVAQARLLRGAAVTLRVSTGRPVVPAIGPGTSVADAEQAVRAAHLTPATGGGEFSDTVPSGAVVRTDPAAGTALPVNGTVTLVLSKGQAPPPQVRIPFLIGEGRDQAVRELRGLGLDVRVVEGLPFTRDNARVVGVDPSSGDTVERGTTVTLTVL
ncbi:Stk1 family PASTA domain-containing Ser/Thr kinase [Pseudonocardia sp. WMMC193]|uniref:Stk1 family PASTA domain-containing Ser/Thr kinase n=1 Tax=Pseudonocardia sp. WMMC193 TaxID=2911965 RepID=UPI001F026120|nr:Stk1 family PASTA domain-containing Ser/Thr kinase [Pseudonocardia sp. WMMC193]MCF7548333.1 Stk1 family PASTA domain-containing Ser/Thr kinase [Pseudonocardia sp. WMMC193]